MQTPGEYLKKEREMRGVSVEHIAAALRLSVKTIEALEADDYVRLPHRSYVKGFIKSYCAVIGLDETDSVLRYESYLDDQEERARDKGRRHGAPAPGDQADGPPPARRAIPNRLLVTGFVVAGCLVIAAYLIFSTPAVEDTIVVERPPAVEGMEGKTSQLANHGKEKALSPAGAAEAVREAPPAVEQKSPAAQATKEPPAKEPLPAAVKEAPADKAEKKEAGEAAAAKYVLDVKATAPVWIKAEIDGGEPFEVIFQEGERARWKASEVFF